MRQLCNDVARQLTKSIYIVLYCFAVLRKPVKPVELVKLCYVQLRWINIFYNLDTIEI